MFVRPLACAFLLVAGAAAQDTTEEGFMTIQTSAPSETDGPLTNPLHTSEIIPQLTFCEGVYTNTPCATVTGEMSIPQGETPIPSSLLSSLISSVSSALSTAGSSEGGSSPAPTSTASRGSSGSESPSPTRTPTSSASGSVQSPTSTPGAASSTFKRDGSFVWAAALSGLSATLGFAWTLL